MGYDTKFRGQLTLSRPLTLLEAKQFMDLADADDASKVKAMFGVDTCMQWVPTETLDGIVWDGGEKFRDSEELLTAVCKHLDGLGVIAGGTIYWQGEDMADSGELVVFNNQLTVIRHKGERIASSSKPLTSRRLGELAIEALSKQS